VGTTATCNLANTKQEMVAIQTGKEDDTDINIFTVDPRRNHGTATNVLVKVHVLAKEAELIEDKNGGRKFSDRLPYLFNGRTAQPLGHSNKGCEEPTSGATESMWTLGPISRLSRSTGAVERRTHHCERITKVFRTNSLVISRQ